MSLAKGYWSYILHIGRTPWASCGSMRIARKGAQLPLKVTVSSS